MDMFDIFSEIVSKLEDIRLKYGSSPKNNTPTAAWVAGKLQQLQYIDSIEKSLASNGDLLPEKREEYEKIVAMKNIAIENKLVKFVGNRILKTDKGSKFVQELAKKFNTWQTMYDKIHILADKENDEWYNSLNEQDKHLVKLYKDISPRQYAYLMGLIDKKMNKKNYSKFIDSSEEKNPEMIDSLKSMEFINADNTLNTKLISQFLNFLNDKTYARLKAFNKEISYITDRISADRALMRNYIQRNLDKSSHRRNELAMDGDQILDNINDYDKNIIVKAYKGSRISSTEQAHLNRINILKGKEFTDIGRYVAAVLTGIGNLDSIRISGEKPTQYSRLSAKDVGDENNKQKRMQDKTHTKNLSFKNFLKNTRMPKNV